MSQETAPHLPLIDDWSAQARLVTNIPDLSSYEDTLKVVGELSKQLARCEVICVEGQALSEEQRRSWPRLRLISVPRRGFPRHAARWLARRARAERLDIIHDFFGHLSSFCERAHSPDRPYVMVHTQRTTNWGWFERVRPLRYQIDQHYAGQRVKSLWYDARILHAVDHITVMGPGHEGDLITGHNIPRDRVRFIPSETDCDRFHPPTDRPVRAQRQAQELLYVGALVRAKGLECIFDVFEALGRVRPHLTLSLIGRLTPFDRRWVSRRIATHPLKARIYHQPFMPRRDLIERYQRADLFVFPSRFEGSPRALREAVACGLSAVASDIPGNRGVDPEGSFVRFAPLDDAARWETLISEALDEPEPARRERAARGVERLKRHHSPSAVARAWRSLYEEIALRRGLAR